MRPPTWGQVLRAGATAFTLAFLLSGCASGIASFETVSGEGDSIRSLFLFSFILSAVIVLIVAVVLVMALIRFRARPGAPEPRQVHGRRRLEIGWTSAALAVVALLFALSLLVMNRVQAAQEDELRIQVIAHQWWWEYRYPDLGVTTANQLHVPAGTPLRLEIQAADVVHSFWVPRFGWKMDAIPNKTNTMRVTVDRPGTFDGTCTEFCGTEHAWMRISVMAQTPAGFQAWVNGQRQPAAAPSGAAARRGLDVFLHSTCVNCHTVAGTPASGTVGPDLTHFASRTTLGAGVVDNTAPNLRAWVRNASSIKPGVLMPSYNFAPADLDALVIYLESLK